jgi:putative sigma-54 modulation protein
MKITYTGQAAFSAPQQKKLDAKFAKLGKLLDRGGEREAHVILTSQRHLNKAEITVRYYDNPLVGVGANTDTFTAVTEAADKVEKQILRVRTKWRDTKRTPEAKEMLTKEPAAARKTNGKPDVKAKPKSKVAAKPSDDGDSKRIFKVNQKSRQKPMTIDEAVMGFDDSRDYMVYRDADSDRVNILVKRRDGHFDLIES